MDANIKQMGNLWDSAEYMFMSPFRNTSFTMFVLSQQILHYRFKMRLLSCTRIPQEMDANSFRTEGILSYPLNPVEFCYGKHYTFLFLVLEKSQIKSLFSGAKRFLEKSICSISFSICTCCILQSFALQVN